MIKNLFELHQVQKFDQCQKPAKWTQPFAASPVCRGGLEFSGLSPIIIKTFIAVLFRVMLFSPFNHLGYLLFHRVFMGNAIVAGNPDGFSILAYFLMQDRGHIFYTSMGILVNLS